MGLSLMLLSDSDLISIRDSRSPLIVALEQVPSDSLTDVCRRAVSIFTGVAAQEAPHFENTLRLMATSGDYDRLLSMIRESFTEFRYDDFPQLEGHYHDVLAVICGLLSDIVTDSSFRPGVVEWLLATGKGDLRIVFNLRGSAEEAAGKITLKPEVPVSSVGVSFSAFDRRIDRWCPLFIKTN